MEYLPKVITTSVIRSSYQGESHGGIYLVDLQTEETSKVFDWNTDDIDWSGRGADRGLRGIAFYNNLIYLAASDEVFLFDQDFRIVSSIRNRYLKHCHEIFIRNDHLYLTSTGHNSILEYSLKENKFVAGYNLSYSPLSQKLSHYEFRIKPRLHLFDPNAEGGPEMRDTLHINNVYVEPNDDIFISGVRLGAIYEIEHATGKFSTYFRIPYKTHNAQPFREGVILNYTHQDKVIYLGKHNRVLRHYRVITYPESDLLMNDLPKDHARQGFGRGLCSLDHLLIAGSSPATISVYDLETDGRQIKTVNISMDVRNSIHGLEIWPYS